MRYAKVGTFLGGFPLIERISAWDFHLEHSTFLGEHIGDRFPSAAHSGSGEPVLGVRCEVGQWLRPKWFWMLDTHVGDIPHANQ